MAVNRETENPVAGIWYSILAYSSWGILPLYWKLLSEVPALEVLAHRIFWSFIFTASIVFFSKRWKVLVAVLADKQKLLLLFLGGVIISFNWYTYIWAVHANQVIEASMGYYINPLVVVLLGVIVFKEKLNRYQIIAICLASIGVLAIVLQYGKVPWVAFVLAGTFASYGLIKKLIKVDYIAGLSLETFIVMPISFTYIINRELTGIGALGLSSPATIIILIGTGVITALPLLFFAQGAQRIKLSMLGFLQYIAPTISLFLGIFVFNEYFSLTHLFSFGFIWAGLFIFTYNNLRLTRK